MRLRLSKFRPLASLLPLVLLVAAVVVLVLWPRSRHEPLAASDWTCSMHPQVRLPQPGQCPICGMDLIPVSQLRSLEARAGIATEPVARRELFKEIRTVGKLDYNETRVAYITARIAGRVDRLYVDFTGIDVEQNDHLVDIYSPSLVVAQEELLRGLDAVERQRPGAGGVSDQFLQANLQSARDKLRLWGILPEQIAELEANRKPREHMTLYAPMRGTVIEKNVRVGQYVEEGDLLYRIAELDPIWLYLDIYESEIAWIRYGQPVAVALEAMPGETYDGIVTFIDPFLDDTTRTVKVRVNLANADRRLKPGMYASASIRVPLRADGSPAPTGLEGQYACPMHPEFVQTDPGLCGTCQMALRQVPSQGPFAYVGRTDSSASAPPSAPPATSPEPGSAQLPLAVRASAVLDTGRRQIAYRKRSDGAFELVALTVGPRAVGTDDLGEPGVYYTVLEGLAEHDEVVARAGFLLDSQRQIEGMPSLFFPAGAEPAAEHAGHHGHGAHGAGDPPGATRPTPQPTDMDKMRAELQKLPAALRASAERQHVCPVTGKMLGTMGPPQQVKVQGQLVWICCPGCRDALLRNPDQYLNKLAPP